MQSIRKIDVYAGNRLVGTLAEYGRGRFAFGYSAGWLMDGFSISPFSLPLEKRLFIPADNEFNGLFGVFDDSLPDGWGRLLTDRYLQANGIDMSGITPLARLAMLPDTASGLLSFRPRLNFEDGMESQDLESLFSASRAILGDTAISIDDLNRLYMKGGSSGGSRPKVNMIMDDDLWIVKFPAQADGDDAGLREYECNQKASQAGLDVAEYRLVPSSSTKGFFASRRFDRISGKRIHMLSLSGLLESSHRYPALDYRHFLKATLLLTRSEEDVYEAFRRACFNVFLGNQDDHGKNFAFLYDEEECRWCLSPAFDLTESHTYYGEHSTTVCGKGRDITEDDLRRLADDFQLRERIREEIIRDVRNACIPGGKSGQL